MIEREVRAGCTILRLAHGKANALDPDLSAALADALTELAADAGTRAVVLVGSGRMFSAGVDLRKLLDGGPDYVRRFLPALDRLLETLLFLPKPVVAAINGHAIAGGCVLACACDHRIMARGKATIGLPELRVGVPIPLLATEAIRATLGPAAMMQLVYGAATLSVDEALRLGVVDALAEPDDLVERAVEVATSFGAAPPTAFRLTKAQIRQPTRDLLDRHRATTDAAVVAFWTSDEAFAAIRAYVEVTLSQGPAKP